MVFAYYTCAHSIISTMVFASIEHGVYLDMVPRRPRSTITLFKLQWSAFGRISQCPIKDCPIPTTITMAPTRRHHSRGSSPNTVIPIKIGVPPAQPGRLPTTIRTSTSGRGTMMMGVRLNSPSALSQAQTWFMSRSRGTRAIITLPFQPRRR